MRKLLHPFSSQEVRQSLQQGRENLPALLEALTCYFQDAGFRVGALEPSEDEALHREWRECWEAERPLARAALATIPEELRRQVEDVPIRVEEFPDAETARDLELETPVDLLGL